ncbi:MAG: T9SS type A sorting domain-containing protein [Flavobacteriales bacterium]|nr:T9SS type A sorting domain-containing protein [Flavobacteriales bacterium]MCB9363656.1 T9SS type A sorting domain-containing protein [Flavobacteriales bacterium]
MKKLYKLFLGLMVVGTAANAQTVFQSNLSSWASGDPTDWMGSKSTIASSNVTEVPAVSYGTSAAQLSNTNPTSHKRFTTQRLAVTAGETYEIKMWVKGSQGDLRTAYYNVTDNNYGTYNSYFDIADESNGSLVMLSQTVTLAATCDSAEFIISLKNTDGTTDIILDSVAISLSSPPVATPYTIYEIQFTTTSPYDSPHNTELVETSGIVTAVQYNGYYLQDGNGAYNGIFVLDYVNVPNIGDNVTVTGIVEEYFNYTEIKNPTVFNVTGTGSLPNPTVLSSLAANDEQYEGVLVTVQGATCTADTTGSGIGEWTINDGSGALIIDDKMFAFGPVQGLMYTVTGVIDYSYNNFKLLPRDMNDVQISTSIEEINNISVAVYPNPASTFVVFELNDNNFEVQLFDITGKTVKSVNSIGNRLNVSTADLNNGIYFYSIYTNDGSLITTNKFVVNK